MRLSESRIRRIIRQELNEAISKRIRMVSADVVGLYFVCKELGYGDEESGYFKMENLVREFANDNYPELKLSFFDADEVHYEGADEFLVEGPEDDLSGFVTGIKKILFNFIAGGKKQDAAAENAVRKIRLHDTIRDLEDYKTSTPAPAAAPKSMSAAFKPSNVRGDDPFGGAPFEEDEDEGGEFEDEEMTVQGVIDRYKEEGESSWIRVSNDFHAMAAGRMDDVLKKYYPGITRRDCAFIAAELDSYFGI